MTPIRAAGKLTGSRSNKGVARLMQGGHVLPGPFLSSLGGWSPRDPGLGSRRASSSSCWGFQGSGTRNCMASRPPLPSPPAARPLEGGPCKTDARTPPVWLQPGSHTWIPHADQASCPDASWGLRHGLQCGLTLPWQSRGCPQGSLGPLLPSSRASWARTEGRAPRAARGPLTQLWSWQMLAR